ncbi:amidinotransferase [Hymenobacter taeanensis]|uniref:Amidinotransferase n=1 Tax=Hymenobacter taeanensis TaxID=2735321 RepID=A0A6M6BHK1_9BACT|nr:MULTISPECIES: arginine deiminase-related protein [Hymenobacter]QJX48051.1 amidinotransferase [Hymenobacter taeanensis]UOQ82500.1 arginine deiminase-related protein [Hymenobacter sp. 5414T-23]
MQAASTVFLVRPVRFSFNVETAASNHFQQAVSVGSEAEVQAKVQAEFDQVVATLRFRGVRVTVFDDTPEPHTPDSIFPNNWLTLHPDGRVLLYPMCAPNRRLERRPDILATLGQQFHISEVLDLSGPELAGQFLEGTGSMVFDHEHRVAYAAISPRTDPNLFRQVCTLLGYRPVLFHAFDERGLAIYHTNVMMCVSAGVAVVCLESIPDAAERAAVVAALSATGHHLVAISLRQVAHFAGNMLSLRGAQEQPLLALSQRAFEALTPEQRATLGHYCELLPLPIPTIETLGGGSIRCMLAEVYLPEKNEVR